MDLVLNSFITGLDSLRAKFLRFTLRSIFLREVFSNKSQRLLFLFLLATAVYLPLSLFFPLWILIIGPILWGIPHLFASQRFIFRSIEEHVAPQSRPQTQLISFQFLTCAWLLVTLLRLAGEFGLIPNTLPAELPMNWPELAVGALTFIGLASLFSLKLSRLFVRASLFFIFMAACWKFPFESAGVLIIAHNFIAFAYWYRAIPTNDSKSHFWLSLALFTLIHVLLFAGAFDFLYHYITPLGHQSWANMDYSDIGKMIAPWSKDSHLWFHAVVAYAFGQSLHYFVWMKAIPEQYYQHEAPPSFRLSKELLASDVGKISARFVILGSVASLGIWALFSYPEARAIYFCVAAFHGYMEITGLFLQSSPGKLTA